MAKDRRSKNVVFVAHCLLNQNVRLPGRAVSPGVFQPLVDLVLGAGCGIVQMPCPELEHFGLGRTEEGPDPDRLAVTGYQERCSRLASDVAGRMIEYLATGYRIACVVGVAGSASCGVGRTPEEQGAALEVLGGGEGLFCGRLRTHLASLDLDVPFVHVPLSPDEGDLSFALAGIGRLLGEGPQPGRALESGQPATVSSERPRREKPVRERPASVGFDDERVWCHRPDGTTDGLAWGELESVVIQTAREVPIQPDAFWVLSSGADKVVFPMGIAGEQELLIRLQQLPGFDDEALVGAVSSTTDETFTCFQRRTPGEG